MLLENQIYIDDNTLSVNVTILHTKLKDLGLTDCIRTRWVSMTGCSRFATATPINDSFQEPEAEMYYVVYHNTS